MEDDKYYTPEIEEFHVGFEYEEFDTNGRIKVKIENHRDLSC